MHIALWDSLPVDLLLAGLAAEAISVPLEVERRDAQTCTALLLQQQVDVALLPSLVVLSNTDTFDVLPGAAFSTWKYPYARLLLQPGKAINDLQTVAYAAPDTQEALIARVILREHYGADPAFVAQQTATAETVLHAEHDASLIVGPDVPMLQTEHGALNLGEEWFELVNYPMVWGLFATLKDAASPVMVEVLLAAIRAAEQQRPVWLQAREMPPALHDFYANDLRLRFDDLATASLTELRQYLYYYKITDDLPELPLYDLPDDWEDDAKETPLF